MKGRGEREKHRHEPVRISSSLSFARVDSIPSLLLPSFHRRLAAVLRRIVLVLGPSALSRRTLFIARARLNGRVGNPRSGAVLVAGWSVTQKGDPHVVVKIR